MAEYRAPGTKKSPWKWLILGALVGGAIYFGFIHHKAGQQQAAGQGDAMPGSVATVISKNVAPWSEFSGRIEAVSAAEIRPRVSGQIMAVQFKDGADVKKGQPLFTIDPRPYEAELLRVKGALAAAESSDKNAQQDYARAKKLIRSKAISQSEFDQRSSVIAQATGNLSAAQGAVTAAQLNVDYAHIVAPISGKISRAEITEGNQVEAGASAPLLASIVKLSPIYASFEMDEQTFLHTIQGVPTARLSHIPIEVGLSNDTGTPIKATIHAFDNQIGPNSGTIRVRALIANVDGKLVPGLFAKIRIATPDDVPSILINPAAVGTDQNKKFVLAIGADNKTEYHEVTLGAIVDGLQIVTSGLKEGDQIVVTGLQRLRPGVPIKPMPVDMLTLKPVGSDAPPADAAPAPAVAK